MWTTGNVVPIWDNEYKNFNYVKQPLTDAELTKWRSEGYTHDSFSGMMYDSRNPMPNWCETIASKIGLTNCGFVFYKMTTDDIMPTHVDHFNRYCEVFSIDRKDVWRAIVFLEDWKPGHYFEIQNTAICNYNAGHYVLWSCDVPHAASNIGTQNRYTLQITGIRS